jgi:hypothetical protein
MSEWRQHLVSKRVHQPGAPSVADAFHVLTPDEDSDYACVNRVTARKNRYARAHAAFIQDCGDKWYVGIEGTVADVLQNDKYAHEVQTYKNGTTERGRPITFVHGYFAPKSVKIPDIDDLRIQQKMHLENILERANDRGESPVNATPAFFTAPRKPGKWDEIATAMERGPYKNKGMGFAFSVDGNEIIGELPHTAGAIGGPLADAGKKKRWTGSIDSSDSSAKSARAKSARFSEKVSPASIPRSQLLKAGGALVAAGALTWALYEISRKKEPENDTDRSR